MLFSASSTHHKCLKCFHKIAYVLNSNDRLITGYFVVVQMTKSMHNLERECIVWCENMMKQQACVNALYTQTIEFE